MRGSGARALRVLAGTMVFTTLTAGVPGVAAALDTFDTAPTLAPSQTAGAWYPDRYAPAAFEKAVFGGDNRLRIGISSADSAANRPPAYSTAFYNTQGRKFDLPAGAKVASADLWVGPDWEAGSRRSDLWLTAVDSGGASVGFPIIGFLNGTGFRVWDNTGWHTVGFPAGFTYGRWYNLRIQLEPTATTYLIDGVVVYTSDFAADPSMAGAAGFSNMMLQAYNFGESYDAYWDNASPVTPAPAPPVVSTPAASPWSLALLCAVAVAAIGASRKRRLAPL